jgi:hypothetical protein
MYMFCNVWQKTLFFLLAVCVILAIKNILCGGGDISFFLFEYVAQRGIKNRNGIGGGGGGGGGCDCWLAADSKTKSKVGRAWGETKVWICSVRVP